MYKILIRCIKIKITFHIQKYVIWILTHELKFKPLKLVNFDLIVSYFFFNFLEDFYNFYSSIAFLFGSWNYESHHTRNTNRIAWLWNSSVAKAYSQYYQRELLHTAAGNFTSCAFQMNVRMGFGIIIL